MAGLSHCRYFSGPLFFLPVDPLEQFDLFLETQFFPAAVLKTQAAARIGAPEAVDAIGAGMFFRINHFHNCNYKSKKEPGE